jgi:drug/metabolite transporter (DMT)-like permease
MPFEYLSVVITAAIAWAIWLEVPSGSTLAGTALVIASGLFILQRESKLARAALRRG